MNSISFTCHILAELKDKNAIATITKILEILEKKNFEIEKSEIFFEEPVIKIKEI